jgi:hypothetical protein
LYAIAVEALVTGVLLLSGSLDALETELMGNKIGGPVAHELNALAGL